MSLTAPASSPVKMEAVESNPTILGGTPCFAGTRVPAVSLFEHLAHGYTIDEFFRQFPSVKREQVLAVLAGANEPRP